MTYTFNMDGKLVRVPDPSSGRISPDVQGFTSEREDPEKDPHLYDFRKPSFVKDDVKELNRILKRLLEMGGGSRGGFSTDSGNPDGKMRCVFNAGRIQKDDENGKGRGKVYSSKHNDRNFDSEPEHIDKEKSKDNIYWNWCGNEYTFDEGEQKFYEENFSGQLNYTNEKYIKNGHPERCKTMEEWRKTKQHCPEEDILQIGKLENHPDVETSMICFMEYLEWMERWNEENGYPFMILNWALHQDEEGAPHIQQRMVWIYDDPKTGLRTTGQNKALKKAGVEVTDSSMEEGRYNNRKKEFDKFRRKVWISICRSHGLEIEDTPKPRNQSGLSLKEYKKREEKFMNEVFNGLYAFAKKNLDLAEKIESWQEVLPEVESFGKWITENFQEFRYASTEAEKKRLTDKITSYHSDSVMKLEDKYRGIIQAQDRALNGYDRYVNYEKKHVFGFSEVTEFLKSATPEDLNQISQVLKDRGYRNLGEWMGQNRYWFKSFQKGREWRNGFATDRGVER